MTHKNSVEGGAYGGVDELYREVILDHFKSPQNKGTLSNATAKAEGVNPLCGDQISVSIFVEGDKIKAVRFEGHGCAISQASASMMTVAVKDKPIESAKSVMAGFKKMFGVATDNEPSLTVPTEEELGDLAALEGVKKYPVRIKCALLAWNTLLQAFLELKSGGPQNGK